MGQVRVRCTGYTSASHSQTSPACLAGERQGHECQQWALHTENIRVTWRYYSHENIHITCRYYTRENICVVCRYYTRENIPCGHRQQKARLKLGVLLAAGTGELQG